MERVIVGGVDIRFGGGHGNFDFVLILPRLNNAEICADFVIALCTPRNVVYVGELCAGRGICKWGQSRSCYYKFCSPHTRSEH